MGKLLYYLLILFFLFLLGTALVTVVKSCNTPKSPPTIINRTPTNNDDSSTKGKDVNEDLYDIDTEDDVNATGSNKDTKTGALSDYDKDGNSISDKESSQNENSNDDLYNTNDLNNDDDGKLDKETGNHTSSKSTTSSSKSSMSDNNRYGEFLLISGAYLKEVNAIKELVKLRKLGYDDAEVVVFDRSAYYSVCVDRFDNMKEANSLKTKLEKNYKMDIYIHKKRKSNR